MLAAATLAAPETDQPIAGYIDDLIAENHDQMREQIEFQILVTYQYTGRNLSSDELGRYLDFIESDAAQWFFENMVSAFTNALRKQGQDFAAELANWTEENSAPVTQEKAGDSEPQATKPAE
jgi:hypothetical protein